MVYRITNINQNTMNTLKNLNKFVIEFFSTHNLKNAEESWLSTSVQSPLKSLLNKNARVKDPAEPKRAKSAYLFFCVENRDVVRADLGEDSKATEITKELGVRWNALKANPKKAAELLRLEKLSAEDKKRYSTDMESYVPPPNSEKGKTKRTGPKRANSAYLYFCNANRDKVREQLRKEHGEDPKATQVTKELGLLWNKAKESGNVGEYDKLALLDKKRYFSEKEGSSPKESKKEVKSVAKKPVSKKEVKAKVEPKEEEAVVVVETKKLNGYQLFCAKRRPELKKEFPDEKTIDITRRLSVEWKSLSKEQQSSV